MDDIFISDSKTSENKIYNCRTLCYAISINKFYQGVGNAAKKTFSGFFGVGDNGEKAAVRLHIEGSECLTT